MTHELPEDHTYGVDSTQDVNTNFNINWIQMLNADSQVSQDGYLPFNMDDSLNSNECQDILQFLASNNFEANQEGTSVYQTILDSINFPKQEIIDVTEVQQPVESSSSQYVPSSLPASQNWPGQFDFNVSFTEPEKIKGVSWTYSNITNRLYVAKDVTCPINFSTNSVIPAGVKIRTMALFSSPESASEVVSRCLDHTKLDISKNISGAEHFVRCESLMAEYETDVLTRRHSVVVPFENPPVGQKFSTYLYKFTCFGSCPGLNRRPLMIVFSLEHENKVLGRRKLDIKICACPVRDSRADEQHVSNKPSTSKKRKKTESASLFDALGISDITTSSKKAKVSPNREGYYQLCVKDYKCYEFLKHVKQFYEMIKTIKSMPREVRQFLEEYQKRKGYNMNLSV